MIERTRPAASFWIPGEMGSAVSAAGSLPRRCWRPEGRLAAALVYEHIQSEPPADFGTPLRPSLSRRHGTYPPGPAIRAKPSASHPLVACPARNRAAARNRLRPTEELREYWERLPGDENYLRGVEVAAWDEPDGFEWQVTIWAREYFRDDPLGLELQQRLEDALGAVPGVTSVENASWETWEVCGAASGEALCRAAASVVDELAGRMRVAYDADSY